MSEISLIKQCQTGDENAFGELLAQNYDVIYQIAWRWCGDATNAEDITQNVCIKLAKNIIKYDFKAGFTTWLYRLTVNCAKDFYKSPTQHNQREESNDKLAQLSSIPAIDEKRLQARQMLEKIAELPAELEESLLLVFVQGLSHAQTGEVMNVKESTISWRVHEARKQLKALCEKQAPKQTNSKQSKPQKNLGGML